MSAKVKTVVYKIDPTQGAARFAASLEPPDGYEFAMMERKGSRVVVTFKEKK